MSNINFSDIDETFPIAGQDNSSKGFRDNWGYIKSALETAASEITVLETTAVLTSNLSNSDPINNNLRNSTLFNGSYSQFYGTGHSLTAAVNSSTVDINLHLGDLHKITLLNNSTINFVNWPTTANVVCKVLIHLTTTSSTPIDITSFTSTAATIKLEANLTLPISISTDVHEVFEAWSYDNGDTIFIRFVGEF